VIGRLAPLVAAAALLWLGAGTATTEPAAIEAQRAEVARLQSQLDGINTEVEQAAEAYNGARYQLGLVENRLDENGRRSAQTQRDLESSRKLLAERLRQLYAHPAPSLVEVLISSGSVTAAADQADLLDRVGQADARVVSGLRHQKAELAELRAQLEKDRATAAEAVEARREQKARIEGLLADRQRLLDGANAELKSLLRAEEERRRQEAARQAELARQRQAARAAAAASASATSSSEASSGASPSGSPTPSPVAPPADGGANAAAAQYALQFLGVPYVWGGASPSGFDCSGLATYVFAKYGKSVPHYTGAIWSAFPQVPRDQLQVGDLVFFHGLGHMGIYLGGDQFVHAPHTGDVVKVSQFSTYSGYVGAVRP